MRTSRSNLKDTLFLCEHAAEEVAPIRPFGKLFLEDRLHDRSTVAPVSAHFEHRRPHELLERHHGGHGIPRQAEGQLTLNLAEGKRLPRPDRQLPEVHFCAQFVEDRLREIVIAHRHATGQHQNIRRQPVRNFFLQRCRRIPRNPQQQGNATRLLDRCRNPIAIGVDDFFFAEPLVQIRQFITGRKDRHPGPLIGKDERLGEDRQHPRFTRTNPGPLCDDALALLNVFALRTNVGALLFRLEDANGIRGMLSVFDLQDRVRPLRERGPGHDANRLPRADGL